MGEGKNIETIYNGYRFRSRLEARWAVFFDYMEIEYEYEHEGYEVDLYGTNERIMYLPDFWLPEYKVHAEVKGVKCRGEIPESDAEKMSWMIDFDGPCSNGIILLGNIPDPAEAYSMWWAVWFWTGKGLGYGYYLGDYPDGCTEQANLHCIDYGESAPYSFSPNDDYQVTSAQYVEGCKHSLVEAALTKARQARFEHGETPTVGR